MPSRQGGLRSPLHGRLDALLAAALFGMSPPIAKLLLSGVDPFVLSGLLYLGGGLALYGYLGAETLFSGRARTRAPLRRRDLPWLAGAALAGGVVAPVLLFYGLRTTSAATASLLLAFEIAATTGIAAWPFREAVSRGTWRAVALMLVASALLTFNPESGWSLSLGSLLVLTAAVLWGLDNNLTRRISSRDAGHVAAAKNFAPACVTLAIALLLGRPFPAGREVGITLLLGAVSCGIGLVFYVRSLARLGAARTGALFGTAPFFGVVLAFALFPARPPATLLAAFALMGIAVWVISRERPRKPPSQETEEEHPGSHETSASADVTGSGTREARGTAARGPSGRDSPAER